MSQKAFFCKHKKTEQNYICLEAMCLKNSDYKLACYKCLLETHPHKNMLMHINELLDDAQKNQKKFEEMIEINLQFCQNINSNLEKNIEDMKQKFNQWLDQQSKAFLEQIQKYQFILNEEKEKITTAELTEDQIKNLTFCKLLDSESFLRQNQLIQTILKLNETSFSHYFSIQYESLCKNYQFNLINQGDLPQLFQIQLSEPQFVLEKCLQVGCCNEEKNRICLEKECLQKQSLILECPSCITAAHGDKWNVHKQSVLSVQELRKIQNKYISDLESFCEKKEQEIQQESESFQAIVMEYQKTIERKLELFKKFIQEREKEIQQYLYKFKSQYSKEGIFEIRRELLLQTDFSVIADIVQLEKNYKQIIGQFKQVFAKEKELNQQDFQDLWFRSMSLLQKDKICYLTEKFINPVSAHIQELNDKINRLTAENYNLTSIRTENQQQIEELDKIVKVKTLESEQFIKIEKIIEQNIKASSQDSKAQLDKIIEIVSNLKITNTKVDNAPSSKQTQFLPQEKKN